MRRKASEMFPSDSLAEIEGNNARNGSRTSVYEKQQ